MGAMQVFVLLVKWAPGLQAKEFTNRNNACPVTLDERKFQWLDNTENNHL